MSDVQGILKLSVPVIVVVGQCSISIEDVLNLSPGAILELDRSADDDLDLLVNNRKVGLGVAVKVGENFGIRITSIDAPDHRIEAMSS
ncbi:MAG: hypothetical protein CMJ18_21540 [Phycisphaeraceae bacterium]|nr:hypothetical protein [Phycisphaeraceae bacterium]